jgi:hypothetical protein
MIICEVPDAATSSAPHRGYKARAAPAGEFTGFVLVGQNRRSLNGRRGLTMMSPEFLR